MKSPEPQRLASAPGPADIGIVMAMPIEAGYVIDGLIKVRKYSARNLTIVEGELAGKLVAVVVAGMGRQAASRGAELLITGHRPRWLLSAGFAGGLDPALARNDLVMPHEVVDPDGDLFDVNPEIPALAGIQRQRGRLLTVDRIVAAAAEKDRLRQTRGGDLVDMETAAVALAARGRSVRVLSLRVISDDAAAELPPEIAGLLTHSGSYRLGVAMRAIWNRPSTLKDFWQLHARALESADRLASGVARLLGILPPG